MNCRIADLNVVLNCETITMNNAQKYKFEFSDEPDIIIVSDSKDIQKRIVNTNFSYDTAAYIIEWQEFQKKMLDFSGVYFHSSAVVVDEKAYLFSAPCGTGKSTHTEQWLKLFPNKAFIINDDKPVVRVMDDGIFVYGTPWSGKHDISVNTRAKLQGICFLERGDKNEIDMMAKNEAVVRLFHAALHKLSREKMQKELNLISSIIEHIPIYKMKCLPNIAAAKMSYRVMSKPEVS